MIGGYTYLPKLIITSLVYLKPRPLSGLGFGWYLIWFNHDVGFKWKFGVFWNLILKKKLQFIPHHDD
jgi:hypothetical protein